MRMNRIIPLRLRSPAGLRVFRLVVCLGLAWGSGAAIVRAIAVYFANTGEHAYAAGQMIACVLIPVFIIIGFGWRRYGLPVLGLIGIVAALASQVG